jgi:hypothetical protein
MCGLSPAVSDEFSDEIDPGEVTTHHALELFSSDQHDPVGRLDQGNWSARQQTGAGPQFGRHYEPTSISHHCRM